MKPYKAFRKAKKLYGLAVNTRRYISDESVLTEYIPGLVALPDALAEVWAIPSASWAWEAGRHSSGVGSGRSEPLPETRPLACPEWLANVLSASTDSLPAMIPYPLIVRVGDIDVQPWLSEGKVYWFDAGQAARLAAVCETGSSYLTSSPKGALLAWVEMERIVAFTSEMASQWIEREVLTPHLRDGLERILKAE